MLVGGLRQHHRIIVVFSHESLYFALEIRFVLDVKLVVIVIVAHILKVDPETIFKCLQRNGNLMSGACES